MEQKRPLISVIVPVYNVEPYLDRCLGSLAAQTYSELEIIVIDDASKDHGGKICDAWAAKDPRLQAVHFPVNRGLSAARNEGVRRAAGPFVCFVDSDDYVEPNLLERLYESLVETGAQISICAAFGLEMEEKPCGLPRVCSREETARCLGRRSPFIWTAWGKLYPLELVKKCPFDERALCCEDLLFFYQILRYTERVSYLPEALYHYSVREGSLVNSGVDEKRCTVLSVLNHICADASAHFPEAVTGFRQVAMNTNVRLAMEAVERGTARGLLFPYLRRFQKNIRRHFSWKALVLSPGKKDMAAELLLCADRLVFWAAALAYKHIKHGARPRKKEAEESNG